MGSATGAGTSDSIVVSTCARGADSEVVVLLSPFTPHAHNPREISYLSQSAEREREREREREGERERERERDSYTFFCHNPQTQ